MMGERGHDRKEKIAKSSKDASLFARYFYDVNCAKSIAPCMYVG